MHPDEKDRIRKAFLNRLATQFTRSVADTEAAHKRYLLEVARQVSPFSNAVLDRAVDLILQRVKTTRWPPIATLYEACLAARNELEPQERARSVSPRREAGRLPERIAIEIALRADCLLVSNAVEGGWHPRLIDFVRDNRRMPEQAEQESLVLATQAGRRQLETMEGAQVAGSFVNYGLWCLQEKRQSLMETIRKTYLELEAKGAFHGEAQDEEASF